MHVLGNVLLGAERTEAGFVVLVTPVGFFDVHVNTSGITANHGVNMRFGMHLNFARTDVHRRADVHVKSRPAISTRDSEQNQTEQPTPGHFRRALFPVMSRKIAAFRTGGEFLRRCFATNR